MKQYVNDYKMVLVEARQNDLIFHNANVGEDQIVGKILFRFWPLSGFGRVS